MPPSSFIRLCLVSLTILSGAAVAAQSPPPAKTVSQTTKSAPAVKDTALTKLFEKPAELKWGRYFRGRLDDVSEVQVSLAYDGKSCRGWFTYAKTRTRFKLDGVLNAQKLELREYDSKGALTGYLNGTLKGDLMELDWSNHNQSLGSKIVAVEVGVGRMNPTNCGDDKWTNRYTARYKNAPVELVLARTHNGALSGYLWVGLDGKSYVLRGRIKDDQSYQLDVLNYKAKTVATLMGSISADRKITCNWRGNGEIRTFDLSFKDMLVTGCFDHADYRSSYDVLYPRTRCESCNVQLDRCVNEWVDRCKSLLAAKKEQPNAQNRATLRASGWMDVECWTEAMFSGLFTFTDTWSGKAEGVAFNFDLKTGEAVTAENLFVKSFDHKAWLDAYIKKESPKLPAFGADPVFREWLVRESFPLLSFRHDGLVLSTLFHPEYGRQQLLVPYDLLKPYLKRDSPVAVFYQK
ncbi:MAG: hypothetical protein IT270_19620 [Saprospiraceae bacterium]|nr:hypothetical protein [Saprospiraceae bacterium]